MVKRQKRKKVYEPLRFFSAFKPAFIYYFKSILYIIFLNFFFFCFLNKYLLAIIFMYFQSVLALLPFSPVNVAITLDLLIVFIVKIVVYTIVLDNMYKELNNDIFTIITTIFKKFFPICITIMVGVTMISFMAIFFLLPGIIWLAYSYYSIPLTVLRTQNIGSVKGEKPYCGISAILRSKEIAYGSALRILLYNFILLGFLFPVLYYLQMNIQFTTQLSLNIFLAVKYMLLDFPLFFCIIAMFKAEENFQEVLDKQFGKEDLKDALLYEDGRKGSAAPVTKGKKK